ncbi:hypothetical protein EDC19_1844 [Natranaerovirga hydrolytica]|uniref:Uncharacterized protein n=1 Tax=Natranaerovirga hydrolytica TaxID=680378 RepID=A0A4R1MQ85_9FIRM|nr:hypothetical protein EDC19_1844 [Natranaerovirga hydrolytica]
MNPKIVRETISSDFFIIKDAKYINIGYSIVNNS